MADLVGSNCKPAANALYRAAAALQDEARTAATSADERGGDIGAESPPPPGLVVTFVARCRSGCAPALALFSAPAARDRWADEHESGAGVDHYVDRSVLVALVCGHSAEFAELSPYATTRPYCAKCDGLRAVLTEDDPDDGGRER